MTSSFKRLVVLLTGSGTIATAVFWRKKVTENESSEKESYEKNHIDFNDEVISNKMDLAYSVNRCRQLVNIFQCQNNVPGVVVGISRNGQNIWIEGTGLADIETGSPCRPNTVMRIASISKSLTTVPFAKLLEEERLDLDKSVHHYLKEDVFPHKFWDSKKVDITLRQLLSHTSGIRHYKNGDKKEMELDEYYLNDQFDSVKDALKLFKHDSLLHEPGSKYAYSTHAWTLIAAIMESVLPEGVKFEKHLIDTCQKELGMHCTYLDENEPIISNRAKYYKKKNGILVNVPSVNNSYKWAGGGLLSSVPDILQFGNIMLYSYLGGDGQIPGFLKQSTVKQLWTPVPNTKSTLNAESNQFVKYALGWAVVKDAKPKYSHCAKPSFSTSASHGGAAVGASSHLLILPEEKIVVVAICNLESASGIGKLTTDIAKQFSSNADV